MVLQDNHLQYAFNDTLPATCYMQLDIEHAYLLVQDTTLIAFLTAVLILLLIFVCLTIQQHTALSQAAERALRDLQEAAVHVVTHAGHLWEEGTAPISLAHVLSSGESHPSSAPELKNKTGGRTAQNTMYDGTASPSKEQGIGLQLS